MRESNKKPSKLYEFVYRRLSGDIHKHAKYHGTVTTPGNFDEGRQVLFTEMAKQVRVPTVCHCQRKHCNTKIKSIFACLEETQKQTKTMVTNSNHDNIEMT